MLQNIIKSDFNGCLKIYSLSTAMYNTYPSIYSAPLKAYSLLANTFFAQMSNIWEISECWHETMTVWDLKWDIVSISINLSYWSIFVNQCKMLQLTKQRGRQDSYNINSWPFICSKIMTHCPPSLPPSLPKLNTIQAAVGPLLPAKPPYAPMMKFNYMTLGVKTVF